MSATMAIRLTLLHSASSLRTLRGAYGLFCKREQRGTVARIDVREPVIARLGKGFPFLSLLKRMKYMKNPLMFFAGRGTCFEIDGPNVVITRDDVPLSRVPFVDLVEFVNSHPLRADLTVDKGENTMQASDLPQFRKTMDYLALNFPDRVVTPELFGSYFNDLSGYPVEAVSVAATDIVRHCWEFPKIVDFVRRLEAGKTPGSM
ncbi:hypothetical protein SBF1_830014 [Candidatus Desulfosporosinus infrequens]|uniref:Uncharacterized protein n=1 Tax=Candidatus Desulfosporosinus infrequens TaxID=2043169 RepID=A0A2U3LU43_9FIRM|nr:hypothetical protein SBF1_830014 [Candidatus Desulfosporosinus infrequens]